jgi:hypothetical protein
MAVYEHTYKQFSGEVTPRWSRFLILPRHSYRSIFGSKLFIAFFVACFIYPLICSILIYLHHNAEALAVMELAVRKLGCRAGNDGILPHVAGRAAARFTRHDE